MAIKYHEAENLKGMNSNDLNVVFYKNGESYVSADVIFPRDSGLSKLEVSLGSCGMSKAVKKVNREISIVEKYERMDEKNKRVKDMMKKKGYMRKEAPVRRGRRV